MVTYGQVEFSVDLYRVSRPLQKGILPSETMASHDAGVVYFTEYFSALFQLTNYMYTANVSELLAHP